MILNNKSTKFSNEGPIDQFDISFLFHSHNTRTTQWEDPRIQAAAEALSHGNLFSSSSEHSSVETLFSSPTHLGSLGSSQNGKFDHLLMLVVTLKQSVGGKEDIREAPRVFNNKTRKYLNAA